MKALKGALTERGFVVETMAASVGISKESLGRYFRCEREMGTSAFARICQVLRITPAEMFERAERLVSMDVVIEPGVPVDESAHSPASDERPPHAPGR